MTWHNAMKASKLKDGKKKMVTVKRKMVMVGRQDGALFATEALCRHMRWPLAWGAKVQDGCVRCPLHQTTHNLDDGSVVEWSPFPLVPAYGKLVGAGVEEEGPANLRYPRTGWDDSGPFEAPASSFLLTLLNERSHHHSTCDSFY